MKHRFAMMTILAAVCYLSSAALPATALPHGGSAPVVSATGRPVTIAFTPSLPGAPIVTLTAPNHVRGRFVLGTSDYHSYISPAFAKKLHLVPAQAHQAFPEKVVTIPVLGVGSSGAVIKKLQVGVNDLSTWSGYLGERVDGILGAEIFDGAAVAIDFPNKKITFWSRGDLSAQDLQTSGFAGAGVAPLRQDATSYLYSVEATLTKDGRSHAVDLRLNTMVLRSAISAADARALLAPAPALLDKSAPAGVRLTGLTIGTASLAPEQVDVLGDDSVTPALGMQTLSRSRILIDALAQKVYISPRIAALSRTASGPSLVHFVQNAAGAPFLLGSDRSGKIGIFQFNTNTDGSWITPAFVAKLHLTPKTMTRSGTSARYVVLHGLILRPGVDLGNKYMWLEDFPASDRPIDRATDGILGADTLLTMAVGIDCHKKVMSFWNHGDLTADELKAAGFENAEVAALGQAFGQGVFTVQATVMNGGRQQHMDLLLDTGNHNSVMTQAQAEALNISLKSVTGYPRIKSGRVDGIQLGSVSVPSQEFYLTHDVGDLPSLGMSFLSHLNFIMDVPGGKLYFMPAKEDKPKGVSSSGTNAVTVAAEPAVR